ncbi:MAG: DUF4919 domain-containing protein [Prevotella sp.]|nr:DUF4919 domain-containing protein [Prevotella sp.]
MKKITWTIIFACCMLALTTHAQIVRQIQPVDWKEVKKVADEDPQRIRDLVARMSADKIDTTMTWNERILAYYGQSYLTPNTEMSEGVDQDKLMKEGKYEECLALSKETLKKNPVSLKALSNAVFAITRMLKDSTNHYDVTVEEGQIFFNRMSRIFNTIAITGVGTEKLPFSVTSVSDEYLFMRYYLDIWEIERQSFTGKFDVFDLKETSQYYNEKKIYFDITRVMEIEKTLFNFH